MAIGLAIQNIAKYLGRYQQVTSIVDGIQRQIQMVTLSASGNPQAFQGGPIQMRLEKLQAELAMYTFLQGLFKEFIEYWKQVLKDLMAMIKSLSELAQGAR